MGIVTAAYALGAAISPVLFDVAIAAGGVGTAMLGLAAALVVASGVSAAIMATARAHFRIAEKGAAAPASALRGQALLWLGYFGGVLAGLMVIGHAAALASSLNPGVASWIAPMIIAVCNLLGSLVGGRLADKVPIGILLATLALITSAALLWLAILGTDGGLYFGLGVGLGAVGFAYGGTITAYPAAIAKLYGMEQSATVYGRVFTAWGSAGLLGPLLAGYLFDLGGDYMIALFAAAGIGLISVAAVATLFWRQSRREC